MALFNVTKKTDLDEKPLATERYNGDLFYYAMDYASSPDKNYLSNIHQGIIPKEEFFELMREHLVTVTNDEEQIKDALKRLESRIWGYYIIEQYLNDDTISDIKILDENNIRLKKKGQRISATEKFRNLDDYIKFVDNVCTKNKISLSDINAIQVFTDTESNDRARLRFNLTSKIINSNGRPVIHIRKILKNKKSLDDLITAKENNMIPERLLPYLKAKAKYASGIVFTGKGASGKTTLMNALLDEIPKNRSGLVIQESDELFSSHPDMMFQRVVASSGESSIEYNLQMLTRNGLLTDLDYFIIGEIKGDEAANFMNAAYTGHKCWTSSHGKDSKEAMNKLADYVIHATNYGRLDVLHMLRFLQVVIFMKDYKIEEISEVVGVDETTGELIYKTVYDRLHPEECTIFDYVDPEEEKNIPKPTFELPKYED